ncbi:PTS lactose/cellobiose transporter subunit IIA [Gottfriedia sp. NPDC057948]|jgi:PTS system cellobiose-specific IIA component|uniref:PTS cellobiose transporter subunit IIA n=1 Tax=Gottfriedia luciferensis TaxID=178774 RepID=A0ABX2ZP74_9BACI|nr:MULTISPECIES: PTS lactose/cellobiose transporter subunit IIA [Bacillaceae]ODG90520.1 PTS cellobiose transporter subunit IIA [Gottfriedia luciferensis]PET71342.1 PTS lactose/cellobiose transporter subunit IIA [Bacillus sp. AFS001701]PGZ94257.1 PTS lactose/cellobiose transporter subunit IIA [Bacillus sp. AFS029533]SFD20834.1 PTS system, cellobiose-specific IIA component [Bacillus sp. UNCCL81]
MSTLTTIEQTAFQLILHAGNAKSSLMEGMQAARAGNLEEANSKIEEAKKELNLAHQAQTSLIQGEARGENVELSILLIHAQDHLMNALTMRDLVTEIIFLHEKLNK